jgi:hypothetical protein
MHTLRKLPNTSPNRKNAAARKYTFPARSKVVRASSAEIVASEGDYMEDLVIRKMTEVMRIW